MGKQKRKQAEPDVSNKMLKLDKRPKSTVKTNVAASLKAVKPGGPKLVKSVGHKAVKSANLKKAPKSQPPKDAFKLSQPLPTVRSDSQLKEIAEKSREAELLAANEEQLAASEEQLSPAFKLPTGEKEEEKREVVKVKRSNPSLRLKESAAKSFLSISGGPAEDDKTLKVPSYSYMKNRGIVYISHIPHGFYEKQMREFFSQFGIITNLRLGRSKKTGRSRGFAFVEFKYEEVAKVVAESMNNYLMFDKILKVELVVGEKKSRAIFMGKISPNRPPLLKSRMKAKVVHNSEKCAETEQKRAGRQAQKLASLHKRLATAGIQYDIKLS